jgi:hypothetical protein
MEASSLNSTFHFLCPREKNHKFESKDRLIKHLSNCKLLKGDVEFYSCKYETYHLFVSLKDKEEHEKHCPTRSKIKDSNPAPPLSGSLFKVANPGFDPTFIPKKVQTGYFSQNRERLEREEQMIKTNKSKVRVNVADVKKDQVDGDSIILFCRDEDSYLRMVVQQTNQELLTKINADFGTTFIFNLHSIPLDLGIEATKGYLNQILTSTFVGFVALPLSSLSSGTIANKLRDLICEGRKIVGIKDRRENEYLLIGEDIRQEIFSKYAAKGELLAHGSNSDVKSMLKSESNENIFALSSTKSQGEEQLGLKPIPVGDKRHSGEMIGKGKISLIYLVKSDYYRKVAEKSLEERKTREATDLKELDARKAEEKRKLAQDEHDRLTNKCLILERTNEGLRAEIGTLGVRLLQDDDSSAHVNVIKTNQEIANLKSQIMEQQTNFTEELKVIKDQKMADYMRILIDDLTKLNDKIIHYKNNILAYQENIGKVDTYNQDTQKMIDNYRVTTDDYRRQIEGCRDLLSKEKDIAQATNKEQKKAVILKKELSCHICKSSYVSMVTKPCNHCLLCWSCFHAFVQNNLRNCLACDEKVDFCFKIKYI